PSCWNALSPKLADCKRAARGPPHMNCGGPLGELFASLAPSSTNGLHGPTKKVCFGSDCDKLTAARPCAQLRRGMGQRCLCANIGASKEYQPSAAKCRVSPSRRTNPAT